ncbi:MAG TPA: class I SAM-dependent methyltransferase [Gemmatimonadales bacterium]|jgi:SAM-dependent methyltransferase|nr:class I SAM-dependent methyltransferase [Gemmatimonadales bacterium]
MHLQEIDAALTTTTPGDYLLGHSALEQRRLAEQAVILQPMTARLLDDAGMRRGMRVLDVGCGVGDVTCLVADMAGPEGEVVGLDFACSVLSTARSRAASRGLAWARFVEGNVAEVSLEELGSTQFDAVVGRLVLMYQPDPAAVLRHLSSMVRPGGVVAFLEGVGLPPLSRPYRPLYVGLMGRLLATFELSGARVDMGLCLHQAFVQAGLPEPEVRLEGMVIAGPDAPGFRWLTELVRSTLPAMERLGVATAEEIEIDTLADRLAREAIASPGAVCGFGLGGAWVRTPSA